MEVVDPDERETIPAPGPVPAIDRGQGAAGFIMLGGSSLDLNKEQTSEALDLVFSIGDDPASQGINAQPVRWCKSVVGARWLSDEEER